MRLIDLQLPQAPAPKINRLDAALGTLKVIGGAGLLLTGIALIGMGVTIAQ